MVAEPEDVSWSSVGRSDSAWYSIAEARDRSLSYIDLRSGSKIINENRNIFESVRKFGRPRQQCSDSFAFEDRKNYQTWQEENYTHEKKNYISEPGKNVWENVNREILKLKCSDEDEKEEFEDYKHLSVHKYKLNVPRIIVPPSQRRRDLLYSTDESSHFKTKMHRWNEIYPEDSYGKQQLARRFSYEEEITETMGDVQKRCSDENVEEVRPRLRRDIKTNQEKNRFESNFQEDFRSREQQDQTRISDIGKNWTLRIIQEDEKRVAEERRKKMEKKIPEFQQTNERELHRSKSMQDLVEGGGRRSHEWLEEENRKTNAVLMDTPSENWGVYNEQQEVDSLNDPTSLNDPVSSPEPIRTRKLHKRIPSGKNFFGHFMTSRGTTPTAEMLDYKEPFSQLWMVLSSLYGQALIILMFAFCLTEVMDNPVKLLTLQGVFLMYLYVGSIAVIICIYIWVLVDSCSSLNSSDTAGLVPPTITTSIVPDREMQLRNMTSSKFGSLKRAHISRDHTSNTSFYLRVGAIAFGLGTLVFNGLEMAMHSMMEDSCLNDVVFVHPILHGLFTFLQMHFLFVNSQVLVERFGLVARFGFMHLAATNLALWIRLVIWESGNEWTYFVHLSQSTKSSLHLPGEVPTPLQLRGFPKFVTRRERDVPFHAIANTLTYKPISDEHISQVVSLHHCLNINSLGQLWTSSMPFLYPFIIQFSLIAAAVTFVMGQKVAKDRLFFQKQKKNGLLQGKSATLPSIYEGIGSWGVDCNRASKGLFLGLLSLVTGVVVIIIFLVVKEDDDFPSDTMFWLTNGTLLTLLTVTVVMNVIGLVQLRKLSVIRRKMTRLDNILSTISMLGVQLYTAFGVVVGAVGIAFDDTPIAEGYFLSSNQKRHTMLLILSIIQMVQTTMQNSLISEGIRRVTLSRSQILTKPARQVITYLLFVNSVLWAFDTFVVHSWVSQELQLRFFGVLVWGVLSRIGLPLLVFFRFHSCVLLLDIWKRSYQSFSLDSGN